MRGVLHRWAFIASVLLCGCASSSSLVWRRVTTTHFVVQTDLDERAAIEAAQELELSRDALISAAWPNFEFSETVRTEVFALASDLEFHRLFGPHTGGIFTHAGVYPSLCLSGPPSDWVRGTGGSAGSTLRHELAHQLAAAVFPALPPRWFTEGLATMLETVRVSSDRASVFIGRPNAERLQQIPFGEAIPLPRLLNWSGDINDLSPPETAGLYSKSWLFFFWLYQTQGEPFTR